ncbi:hypothetical protein K505DRAFT_381972 [Melanomma pulvis-pyrius CBS 109.77]|uniref:Uncharacterized protein n=1 Tax=Melanomma pulvis-pyrius CBS 109.77 TaxID=1314802 RepID=A0A6A6XHJ6_9PLEO|nr:hypothetical protein K505DRAFT_381972 [Melanomma pulvis-pyrius CBS 109.77]
MAGSPLEEDRGNSFNWLSRGGRGTSYINYSQFSHLSASSFDFGCHGVAACCNYGGELLHLSSPSEKHGLIFARGNFSNSIYACLARGQREVGGPSTFGLEVSMKMNDYHPRNLFGASSQGSSFRLGKMLERGCFNYRWPFNEYSLLLNEDAEKDEQRKLWSDINIELGMGKTNIKTEKLERWQEQGKSCDEIEDLWKKEVDGKFRERLKEQKQKTSEEDRRVQDEKSDWDEKLIEIDGLKNWNRPTAYTRSRKLSKDTDDTMTNSSSTSPTEANLKAKRETGTCVTFSFVKDGTLYQVLRIEQGCWSDDATADLCHQFPNDSQIVLTVGGPVQFRPFDVATKSAKEEERKGNIVVRPPNNDGSVNEGLSASTWRKKKASDGSWKTGEETYKPLRLRESGSEHDNGEVGTGNATAYHAYGRLPSHTTARKKRSATFIAAFRLFEGSSLPRSWKIPTSQEIYTYIGADPKVSKDATGVMWETIFRQRYLLSDPISRLPEVHLIGRCLEKILQVDIVPIACRDPPETPSGDASVKSISSPFCAKHAPDEPCEKNPLHNSSALISNLFILPSLDYRSLFWKVRFLVKASKFLQNLVKDPDPKTEPPLLDLDDRKAMRHIAEKQINRLKLRIEAVVLFLARSLHRSSASDLMQSTPETDESHVYYRMITIWYAIKNLPEFDAHKVRKSLKTSTTLDMNAHIPADVWNFGSVNKDKIPLLQWYHYGSLRGLVGMGILCYGSEREEVDLIKKIHRLQNAALMASAAKLTSNTRYSANDEIFDRLAFLAHELGLETLEDKVCKVASLSRRRVKKRDYTRKINPGFSEGDEDVPIDGPWEVHALSHHSRLMVLNLERYSQDDWRTLTQKAEEVESFKNKLCHFINSEGTLVPCWERSHLKARQGWIHSEASSVVASTLLDMHEKGLDASPKEGVEIDEPISAPDGTIKVVQEMKYMQEIMEKQVKVLERITPEAGLSPPIEWAQTWKPPRQYHPDAFVNSLEDTPHLYEDSELTKVRILCPLQSYISLSDVPGPKRFTRERIREVKGWKDVHVTDVIDNSREVDSVGMKDYGPRVPPRNLDPEQEDLVKRLYDSLVDQDVRHRFLAVTRPLAKNDLLFVILAYVLCPRSVACLSNHAVRLSRFSFSNRAEWLVRITVMGWLPKDIPPSPEKRKRGQLPPSSKLGRLMADKIRTSSENEDATKPLVPTKNGNEEGIFLPRHFKGLADKTLAELRIKNNLTSTLYMPQMSSIVLATNEFGDFSRCTIISELLNKKLLHDIGEQARILWQIFVHQPQTARCLVFFLILGNLCRDIAKQYKNAIEDISSILNLDNCFKQHDEQWSKEENAVPLFQLGLWSLESLYKLQYSLRETVRSILDAKEQLSAQVKDGPGARSEPLEKMCQESLDIFESNLAELTAVTAKLERDIELNSRYKDAFEAILTLTDSRASLRQNDAMQRLTYATIIYLPMGLTAVRAPYPFSLPHNSLSTDRTNQAIFAIPSEQLVVFPQMGLGWTSAIISQKSRGDGGGGSLGVFGRETKRMVNDIERAAK